MSIPAQTTPMRPAFSNSLPAFTLPRGACDTHFHVFEAGYPHVLEPLYTFPDATLDQYLAVTRFLGIERMVLVQPTFYGNDNSLTLDVLKKVGDRCRAVVRIEDDTSDADLDLWHELGVRAIRLDLFARADWTPSDLMAYIEAMAARAASRGWHVQFYTPGAVLSRLQDFLPRLEVPYVVDHIGYGLGTDQLLTLMDRGNCWIKLSGAYRLAKTQPLSAVETLARALAEEHPDRMLWGSDWPHLPDGQRDTGELLDLLAAWVPDSADRHRVLVDSPTELFFS
ncbi:amidohydrolase family protein [Lentzea sp. CA-135723]|uniref:amidohydrolase family protein n=1 Tax=Lentzea sp. CA-135723 TaxID=3239950 RepID=UPI003D938007